MGYPHGFGVSFTFRFLKSRKNACSEHQGIGKCSSIQVAFLSKQLRADYSQAPVNLRSYPRAPLAKSNSIPLPTFLLWRTHSRVLFTDDLNTILAETSNSLRVWILALYTRRSFSPTVKTVFSSNLSCRKQHRTRSCRISACLEVFFCAILCTAGAEMHCRTCKYGLVHSRLAILQVTSTTARQLTPILIASRLISMSRLSAYRTVGMTRSNFETFGGSRIRRSISLPRPGQTSGPCFRSE